jgi:Leucine-rich repeat (LRR) protein
MIDENCFDSIKNMVLLKQLVLDDNWLQSLPPTSFDKLDKLELLSAILNRIETLPDDVGKLVSLRKLNLRNNSISRLPNKMKEMVSLTYLSLDTNRLKEIPEFLGELTNLEFLGLKCNLLTAIPLSLEKLQSLRYLYLSWQRYWQTDLLEGQLKNLDVLGKLTSLEHLSLADCRIESLPLEFQKLTALQELDLSKNKIKNEIPISVLHMSSLTTLLIYRNDINVLQDGISKLTNLKYLDASNCQLSEISTKISCLTQLEQINLQGNKMLPLLSPTKKKDFIEAISKLHHLETLRLDSPDEFMWDTGILRADVNVIFLRPEPPLFTLF